MRPAPRTFRRCARMLTASGGVLLLLTAVLSIVPAPASAETTPTTTPETTTTITALQGNPTCRDLQYPYGAKIEDPPVTGTYPGTGGTFEEDSDALTLTIVGGTATSFSFEGASPPISAVIVKSGGNDKDPGDEKALLYEFDAPVTGAGPINSVTKVGTNELRDISHVQFCWGERQPTVEKKWYASDGTTPVAAPTSGVLEVQVDLVEGDPILLGLADLDDGPYTLDVAASDVTGVDETKVPTGWTEFVTGCDPDTEDDAYVVCNRQVETDDDEATLKKLWFDSDGDLRAAPSSAVIEITVDLVEGQDIVLDLDDLDDGLVTLPVGVEGVTSVQETTVPSGWREVECATQYADDADFVLCNRRRSSGGGGGGSDLPTPVTTTPVQPAPILPLTPELPAEVLPEVVTTPAPAPAPVLPFTGSGRIEAIAMAGLALVLSGGAATLLARRRPEVEPT